MSNCDPTNYGSLDLPAELIQRYGNNLPRYTSYPTAAEFTPTFGSPDWEKDLFRELQENPESPISIYCHLPFCVSLCYFCACNKIISKKRDPVEPYLNALRSEISQLAGRFSRLPAVAQLHWGGGTPNYLTPQEIDILMNELRRNFPKFLQGADISIELDPRTVSNHHLQTLHTLGFNRLSFGVQDFDPEVQRVINRIQPYEAVARLCNESRALGFGGINMDLIYGLPKQSEKSFESTLEKVCRLRPDRIALYGYAHVTWVSKTQRVFDKHARPSSDLRLKLFQLALQRLAGEGYRYIGMDHFALAKDPMAAACEDGTLHRNFMGYSTHKTATLLGFGMSSISTIPGAYAQNYRAIKEYTAAVREGRIPVERGLRRSAEDRWRGAAIQSVMCSQPIYFEEFERSWGIDLRDTMRLEIVQALKDDALAEVDDEKLAVTPKGRFFLRNIAAIFDSYLPSHVQSKTFSQAV
ncbi:MAG: oxygen-independent coproporphyrinogen III oxidase [Deltaproteobacteria bacterium]|nr:oxygen-independent coproporphyrinogen III oxidase [Deltaproteobacteria bacterium]